MKDLLAGHAPNANLAPLDHCLSCRSCETTCPAGVQYTEILDAVREHTQADRPASQRLIDRALGVTLSSRALVTTVMRVARWLRPLATRSTKRRIPQSDAKLLWPSARHPKQVGIFLGCVQPALAPDLDIKAAIILDRLGISAIAVGPGCCGALPYHLHTHDKARAKARETLSLDRTEWEGFTSTATGCTAFLRDYPRLFKDTAETLQAQSFASHVADLAVWVEPSLLPILPPHLRRRIAWHAPCSLQHGLKGATRVEAILKALGHTLVPTSESALCCGSAGPYSLRHPHWAAALGRRKWRALTNADPAEVVSANIGCLQHLAAYSDRPIRHWIDIVYEALTNQDTSAHD